ncbi:MAG TPA: Uma2 family endonuclease [Thermoanaerobaculia bacterium]|nr:Uma2 family endonuclease [Thermoanaerobaculia bacterium]
MASDPNPQKLTYADYLLIPEDGKRHEIIDGEHFVAPAPTLRHQRVVFELGRRLGNFVVRRKLGQVYSSPVDVLLSRTDVLQPDVLYISRERLGIATENNLNGPPDLVVEVLSDSTRRRDEVLKLHRYSELGVPEYWILDPVRRIAKLYRQGENGLRLVAELSAEAGDVLTTPLLSGLKIPLRTLFE